MARTTPSPHTAAIVNAKGDVDVKAVSVPELGEGEVLVKVIAAALNPTDWKTPKLWSNKPGAVAGHDFVGIVEQLGLHSETLGLKVGNRVASFVNGGTWDIVGARPLSRPDAISPARTINGSFAEYVVARADSCIPLPESWTFEQGAQLGLSIYTAFQTLYQSLNLPEPYSEDRQSAPLLVYGASSAVGIYVIQIAKASGFQVYAVCSPKNYELVKSFGAQTTFDYRDPDVSAKIRSASEGKIKVAVDTISEQGSVKIIVPALSSEGGKIATILPYSDEAIAALGPNITHHMSSAYDLNEDLPGAPSRLGDVAGYCKLATRLLAEGKVKPTPIRIWASGLEGINDAMQYMMDGKVSGEKIIFRIADTPGLV